MQQFDFEIFEISFIGLISQGSPGEHIYSLAIPIFCFLTQVINTVRSLVRKHDVFKGFYEYRTSLGAMMIMKFCKYSNYTEWNQTLFNFKVISWSCFKLFTFESFVFWPFRRWSENMTFLKGFFEYRTSLGALMIMKFVNIPIILNEIKHYLILKWLWNVNNLKQDQDITLKLNSVWFQSVWLEYLQKVLIIRAPCDVLFAKKP